MFWFGCRRVAPPQSETQGWIFPLRCGAFIESGEGFYFTFPPGRFQRVRCVEGI